MKTRWIVHLFFSGLILAKAQTGYNVNIIPVGDIEPLLANTGTAGLNSSGAVLYNPAALTQLEKNSLSLKGSAYTLFKFKADPIVKIGEQQLVYEGSGFQSTPTTLIMVRKLKNWYAAFSVISPITFNFEGLTSWNIGMTNPIGELTILQNYKEKMMLIGLSAATKINERWSLGLSAFAQSYSYLSYVDLKHTFISNPEYIIQNTVREKYNPVHLLIMAGIQRTGNTWNIGARVAMPNLYLFGKGNFYSFSYIKSSDEPAAITEFELTKEKVYYKTPLDLRMGWSCLLSDKMKWATDLSYTLKIKYDVFESPDYEGIQDFAGSYRMSSGLELSILDSTFIYLGGSWNPFNSQSFDNKASYDFYTGTAGIRFNSRYIKSITGIQYTYGKGLSNITGTEDPTRETYNYLSIFLGANYVF